MSVDRTWWGRGRDDQRTSDKEVKLGAKLAGVVQSATRASMEKGLTKRKKLLPRWKNLGLTP